jgi:alpha-D-xyloside xylohydrolase
MSGYSIWGSDIGGYQNSANLGKNQANDADLFMRWTQFACFTPTMQMHRQVLPQAMGAKEQLLQYPWGYTQAALENYQKFAQLHTRLFPYIYTYAKLASENGVPILRPLVLMNQNDPQTLSVQHAYHFGDEFLVAPIVTPNSTSRQVYLPAGVWVDFWSSAVHAGGQAITWINADTKQFPVFVRAGAIVPTLPENAQSLCDANYVNNVAIATPTQDLTFLIYPGAAKSQFTVYDSTQIQCQPFGAARVINLNSIARPVTLQVSGAEPPSVTLNGASLPKRATLPEFEASSTGWRFDAPTQFAFIKFPHTGGSAEVRC